MSLAKQAVLRQLGLRLYAVATTQQSQPIVAASVSTPKVHPASALTPSSPDVTLNHTVMPPRSVYAVFKSDPTIKEEAQETAGSKKLKDIAPILSSWWKELSPSARSKYEATYEQRLKDYEAEHGTIVKRGSTRAKSTSRGSTKYISFVKQNFDRTAEKIKTRRGSEVFKELGAQWRALSEAEKNKYASEKA